MRPWPSAGASARPVRPARGAGAIGSAWAEDLLGEEQELIGVDLLALPAVALAEELFELVLELGDEMDLLPQGLHQLADLAVGGLEVVGECGVAGRHTL